MNQQENTIFSKIIALQVEIVDLLHEFQNIDSNKLELFPILEKVKKDPLYNFKSKTRDFVKCLFKTYGYDLIDRQDCIIDDMIFAYKIKEFSNMINTLEKREMLIVNRNSYGAKHINTFQFTKNFKN